MVHAKCGTYRRHRCWSTFEATLVRCSVYVVWVSLSLSLSLSLSWDVWRADLSSLTQSGNVQVAWSFRDANVVFSAGADQSVRMWDINKQEHQTPLGAGAAAARDRDRERDPSLPSSEMSAECAAAPARKAPANKRRRTGVNTSVAVNSANMGSIGSSSRVVDGRAAFGSSAGVAERAFATAAPSTSARHTSGTSTGAAAAAAAADDETARSGIFSMRLRQCRQLARSLYGGAASQECDDQTRGLFSHGDSARDGAVAALDAEVARLGETLDGAEQAATLSVRHCECTVAPCSACDSSLAHWGGRSGAVGRARRRQQSWRRLCRGVAAAVAMRRGRLSHPWRARTYGTT